jgi:TonB family protein
MQRAILVLTLAASAFAPAARAADIPDCGTGGMTSPAPRNNHAMTSEDYPVLSTVEDEEGMVTLDLIIDSQGAVREATVEKSSGFSRLDDAAVATAKARWLYTPATQGGQPVACRWRANVMWKLDGTLDLSGLEKALINVVQMAPADFPAAAKAAHERGVTGLVIAVDETGKVTEAKVLHSSGYPDLDDAALTLAREKWPVAAGRLKGKPVKTTLIVAAVWDMDGT